MEEAGGGGVDIKVFGPGCPRCRKMEEDVRTVLAETGVDADVEHVSDMQEIFSAGIMGTPALMIDGKVLVTGSVPPKAKLKEWIAEAAPGTRCAESELISRCARRTPRTKAPGGRRAGIEGTTRGHPPHPTGGTPCRSR